MTNCGYPKEKKYPVDKWFGNKSNLTASLYKREKRPERQFPIILKRQQKA